MTHDVTSWFINESNKSAISPVRKFTIGSSDYSNHVIKWPKVRQSYNSIRPVALNVNLSNEDQEFNFIKDDTTLLTTESKFKIGLTHATSGDELITIFSGKMERVKYGNGSCAITFVDKFKQLTERLMGTSDAPVTYTSSNYLPADIAWYAITSYGGYDTTASSANIDIDYASWLEWSDIFSASAVFVHANFDGKKVSEVLKKIGDYTDSAIFVHDNKIRFKRFSLTDSNQTLFDSDSILKLSIAIDNRDVVNKMYVQGDYDVTSKYWKLTTNDVVAASVNSYGLKEQTIKDTNLWYVNSGSAINLAQRKTQAISVPYNKLQVETTLKGLPRIIGETISVTDLNVNVSEGFRIMNQEIDMDSGKLLFDADRSYFSSGFILDTSTLGSSDILT